MAYGKISLAILIAVALSSCSEKMAPASSDQNVGYNAPANNNQSTAPVSEAASQRAVPAGTMQKGGNVRAIQPAVKE